MTGGVVSTTVTWVLQLCVRPLHEEVAVKVKLTPLLE